MKTQTQTNTSQLLRSVTTNITLNFPALDIPRSIAWQKGGNSKIIFPVLYPNIYNPVYNYLFISIFWQKEVESRALTECKNMIFIIITIAESERWLSLLSLSAKIHLIANRFFLAFNSEHLFEISFLDVLI